MLFVGQVLNGIPFGTISVVGLSYASEIAPLTLRQFLTSYVMLCWAMGQLITAGILKGLLSNTTEWGYRLPFAIQWCWLPPLFIATWFVPDSPYWLVRKGKSEQALETIKRLTSPRIHHQASQKLNFIVYTHELEETSQKWGKYLQCFRGSDFRRTEIAGMVMAGQVLGGNNLMYSASYFFSQVGLDSETTYNLNLAITALACLGTVTLWWISSMVGRRRIYLVGISAMTLFLLLTGILQTPAKDNPDVSWGQVGCVFGWVAAYVLSVSPIAYTITGEISSTNLRSQTIAIGRIWYNICQLVSQIINPYFINPTKLNLKGKTAYIWFGTSLLVTIWAYFRLPETKGRTYEELDRMFALKVPARQFKRFHIKRDEI
ncbi:hypothetical protein CLIB1444_03S03334 [[Candida] jaroonii]|uniref:Uncharacterized protein n=1 Tax=[Candida] jaroonii TaxID=467808 RepID=A0ACA9Y586_9ASCO|nr:hypothetical protein CLIB1444_03S03334 [[Candida] jaroonii]